MIPNISASTTMAAYQSVNSSLGNGTNYMFFMWIRVASKASYEYDIKVMIVAKNTSGTKNNSTVRVSNLVRTSLDRVFLI